MPSSTNLINSRLNNSLLTNKKNTIESVLSHVLGVQAQYPNYSKINIINRIHEKYHGNFHKKLNEPDTILAWGVRQTVHFYRKKDWLNLALLLEDQEDWPDKSLTKKGYSVSNELAHLEALFTRENPLKKQIIQDHFKEHWNDLFHWSALFLKASRSGNLYFKLKENRKHYYWYSFEEKSSLNKEITELNLLKHYFSAYGPATKADAAHFFGVSQRFFTLSFEQYFKTADINGTLYYYVEPTPLEEIPKILLLGKFDPLLLAYKDKRWLVSEEEAPLIWRKAAQVEAILLLNGKFSGTWRYKTYGTKVEFNFFLQQSIDTKTKRSIEEQLFPFAYVLRKELHSVNFH